jgi:hypothetical protein
MKTAPQRRSPSSRENGRKISAVSEELEAKWLAAKQAKARAQRLDLLAPNQKIEGPELCRALEFVFQVTGDPLFMDARDALKSYGLDHRLQQSAREVFEDLMGSPEIAWYEWMHNWIGAHQARFRTTRLATKAAQTLCAEERFPQGASFKTDWENLRRDYSKWVEEGRKPQRSARTGHFGRHVWVVPRNGEPLKLGSFHVPAEGVAKPFDHFLRRLYLDGTIMISAIPNA